MQLYTFLNIRIDYQRTGDLHRLVVGFEGAGPWISTVDHPVISYEYQGRYFVGQSLTNDLPTVFELIPAYECIMTIIPPQGTMQ
jgi:hypothetical protein